jgi:hypothetical protein
MGSRCTQAPFLDGNPQKLRSSSMSTVCERCLQEGVPGDLPAEVPTAKEPPVEEKATELLKAARVLFEKDAPEGQVFPTLAFAGYGLGQGIIERFA